MKKAVSFVLSVSLIFSAFCGIVSAETESISVIENEKVLQKAEPQKLMGGFVPDERVQLDVHEGAPKRRIFAKSAPQQDVYEYLETQMKNHVQNIVLYPTYEVGAYYEYDESDHRTYTNIDEFHALLRTVLFNNYDILAYDNPHNCTIVTDGSGNLYIETFSPQYFISEEDAPAAIEMMDDEIENYLDVVRDIPSDDVVGKMVVIHDLICANNMYDTEGLNNEEKYGISCNYARTAYNMFANNMGVCQGYAIALKAIYDKLNEELKLERGTTEDIIETSFCSSNNIAHIWNVVKIDGKWYHLDPTWGDIDYRYRYEYVYEYQYECEYQYEYDEGGNPILDEEGNPVLVVDEEGNPVPVVDEEGNPVLILDGEGNPIPILDEEGEPVLVPVLKVIPVPVQSGWHGYFLKTDSEFATDHFQYDGNDQPIYDWVFYTEEDVTCYDTKYSQGHIFNLEYAYLISYSNGGYNLGLGDIFRSNSIIMTKVLATDPYLYEYKPSEDAESIFYNLVTYFTEDEPVEMMHILTSSDESGALIENRCVIHPRVVIGSVDEEGTFYNTTTLSYDNALSSKIFLWTPGTYEPLCRAIDLPPANAE